MNYEQTRKHPAVLLFESLLEELAPPQHEHGVARKIRAELDRMGWEHTTDGAGNLLVPVTPRDATPAPTVLAAHMDELGLTVSGIEADGRLRVVRSGRIEPHKLGERPVTLLGSRKPVTGVVSLGSSHQGDRTRPLTWNDARIITGLAPRDLEEAGVHIGTTMSVEHSMRGPVFLGDEQDPLIAAWTFDDRMGCVALLRLLDAIRQENIQPQRPLTVAFTVHEEGGCHGAMSLCQRLLPEVFIAVDGCPVTDDMPLALDGRPGVWTHDKRAVYDPALVELFCSLAQAEGIELQRALYENAASDASAAYDVGAAERIGFIGHVRENSHGFEVARLSVFDNVLTVLKRFVREWS